MIHRNWSGRARMGLPLSLMMIIRIAAFSMSIHAAEALPEGLQKLMQTSGFEHGHWGLLVVDAKTRQVIYEQNADQFFCPASVTKLYSTAAALEKLGDSLWRATDEAPRAPQDIRVAGGFVENSNVNSIAEMTQMIEISRAYQSVSRLISQADELRSTSIKALAQVGGA